MLANSVCVKHGDHERGRHLPSHFSIHGYSGGVKACQGNDLS